MRKIIISPLFSNKDILFIFFVFILSASLYQRDIGGHEISKFTLLGLAIVYALIVDYSRLMMGTAFMLPLANGLPGNYIFPVMCVLILLKGREKLHAKPMVWVALVLILVSELLHIFMFASEPSVPNYVGYSAAIFLLLVVGGADMDGSDNSKNALAFCIGCVVMLTIILLNFSLILDTQIQDLGVRVGDTSQFGEEDKMTLGTNPNNIGLYSIATIAISFTLWFYKKIPLWMFAILAILAFIAGVGSISRTWLLSLFVFGLFFLLFNGVKSFSPLIVVVLGVIGIYYFFERSGSEAIDLFADRFSDSQIKTAGSRIELFAAYHKWMFSNGWALLFGTGAETYKEVTQLFNSSHNALQQIFIAYGIPGFIFFMYLLYRSINKWHVHKEMMAYLPFIVILFFLQSSQFLNPCYCMYPIIASFFIMKMVKSDSLHDRLTKARIQTNTKMR